MQEHHPVRREFTIQLYDRPKPTNRQKRLSDRLTERAKATYLCDDVLKMTPHAFQEACGALLANAWPQDRSTFQRYFEKAIQRRKIHEANLALAINSTTSIRATQQDDGTVTITAKP